MLPHGEAVGRRRPVRDFPICQGARHGFFIKILTLLLYFFHHLKSEDK